MLVAVQLIWNAGHLLFFWAPYYAVDGPIEYMFDTLQQGLTRALYCVTNGKELIQELLALMGVIPDFIWYFTHCGYNNP